MSRMTRKKRLVLCNFEKDISFFRRPCEVAASCSHPIKQMLAQTPSQLDAMHAQNQPHHSGKHHLHIWTEVSISWRRAITVSRNVERKGSCRKFIQRGFVEVYFCEAVTGRSICRREGKPARMEIEEEMQKQLNAKLRKPNLLVSETEAVRKVYQRRAIDCCWCWCILEGDTEAGGLDRAPSFGFTIGIAFRMRVAAGWCNFKVDTLKPEWTNGWEFELREKLAEGDRLTWVDWGELEGDPLDSEERSEEEELIDTISLSVRRLGQNSASSSKSNDLAKSNRWR